MTRGGTYLLIFGVGHALVGPQNEALQQTRSALTSTAAALAAERRCSASFAGLAAE